MSAAVPAPVFVLAAPFSGASRLAERLGHHPSLFALPELCLFLADNVGELLDIFRMSQGPQADGLLRAVAVLEFGAQRDAEIAAARDWLAARRDLTVGALLEQLAQRALPRRLVIPDTESTLRPLDLRRLRRHVPGARAIHLTRHPWTQGCRMSAWLRERLFVPPDFRDHAWDPPMPDPQIPWLRCNANIEAAFGGDASAYLHQCSEAFEDEDRLNASLAALCAWLPVESSAAALRAMREARDWVFAGHGPRAAPYGLEADVLEPVPPADLERSELTVLDVELPWRADGIAFDAKVVERARRYGYR